MTNADRIRAMTGAAISNISADECISVLECAVGEAQSVIPDEILQASIGYIEEYKILRSEISWYQCPEISEPKREWDVGTI